MLLHLLLVLLHAFANASAYSESNSAPLPPSFLPFLSFLFLLFSISTIFIHDLSLSVSVFSVSVSVEPLVVLFP